MSIIQFLSNPLLIVDPLNVSIEYLFKAAQTGIIYVGDPDFEVDLVEFARKFSAIIIRHFAFDSDVYQRTYERGLSHELGAVVKIYHVASAVGEGALARLPGSHHVLRFDLFGADLSGYMYHHLKRLLHPPTEAASVLMAATAPGVASADAVAAEKEERSKNRFEKVQRELEHYLSERYSLSSSADTSQIRASVDRLRKLKRGGVVEEALQPPHLKALETASSVFAKYFAVIMNCPFR
jgi:hypothetical protein